jgi:chloramphenicol 3-O phosphotransferase
VKTLAVVCFSLLPWLDVLAASGKIILFNGTSSAGKSSLAEVMVEQSTNKYVVVSFDDFHRTYREKRRMARLIGDQHRDFLLAFYRHAKEQSDAGTNVIIDTVEFDRAYDTYCGILDCSNVIKAIVYCPPQHILKRVEKRNDSGVPSNRRPVLLSFQQFLEMYKPQTTPDELVVEKTSTGVIRSALVEAGRKANNASQYTALSNSYVKVFGIHKDREITLVPKGKYDLALDTKANTKKENMRLVEDYMRGRSRVP